MSSTVVGRHMIITMPKIVKKFKNLWIFLNDSFLLVTESNMLE